MNLSRSFTRVRANGSSYLGWQHFLNDLNIFLNEKVRHSKGGLTYVTLEGEPTGNRATLSIYLGAAQNHDPQKLISATRYFLGEHGIKIINERPGDRSHFEGESVLLTVQGLSRYETPGHYSHIKNQWMKTALLNGTAIDVRETGVEVESGVFKLTEFIPNVEYVDSQDEAFIWSIGKNHDTGEIYAATDSRFYQQDDDWECLYLR